VELIAHKTSDNKHNATAIAADHAIGTDGNIVADDPE